MPQSLREAALEYWHQGLNIVLLYGKQPLHEWQKYETQRQSIEEFEALPWGRADSFAVICGQKNKDGLYIGAADFDVKNMSEEAREKGREVLRHFLVTQIEETPSKGQHWIYLCHNKPKTVSAYHNEAALELIGEGKLCIMAPSQGYKRLNDNMPTEIEDLEDTLYKAMFKAGVNPQQQQDREREAWFGRGDLAVRPYRGKTPNCILTLEKGTSEGLRNEYGIRLASFYGNFKQYTPGTCLKLLRTWNKLNEPSLDNREVEALLRSALQGGYVYGCNDPVLKSVCNLEQCPLAAEEEKVLTETERARAERLLADPKLLDYVLALGRKRLIGEDNILIQNFVLMVSGKTRYPISEVLTGHSGSGKNESIRAILPLIPEHWYFEFTTSTPEAVKYIPEDFDGTLIIYELAGIRSETGTLGLRSIGEAQGIKTIYPVRDEATGEMRLGEKQTNAKNFISTESGLDIAADLYRRVFKNSMNDSQLLTKRVIGKKLRDSSLPESLRRKLFPEENMEAYTETDFQNALRTLDLKAEVIVFPPYFLLDLIKLTTKKEQEVALRSQVDRVLNFIKILALIHQRQRIRFEDSENSYVIASSFDVETALRVLSESITETVSRVERRQRQALDIMRESSESWDKNSLAKALNVSSRTASYILKTLHLNGYLRVNEATRPYSYEVAAREKLPSPLALGENAREYTVFYRKELETFLYRILQTYKGDTHFVLEGIEAEQEMAMEKKESV